MYEINIIIEIRNGLNQSLETPQKAYSFKSRVRSRVYIVGQYIEGSHNARKSTVYPSPAYNGIGKGSEISSISLSSPKLPIKPSPLPFYDSILNPLIIIEICLNENKSEIIIIISISNLLNYLSSNYTFKF